MRSSTILTAACLILASCQPGEGCTDPTANNYDSNAVEDDGSCDNRPEFDGYTYDVVTIGEQVWFAENLQTTVYANGSGIPEVTDNIFWGNASNGARCVYENEESNLAIYGRLYNGHAVTDARKLCPNGWHVPTDEDWEELRDYITSQGLETATALKSTYGWIDDGNGTDDFGFSGVPGGSRGLNFYYAGVAGLWYSYEGRSWELWPNYTYISTSLETGSQGGISVRCLKDTE